MGINTASWHQELSSRLQSLGIPVTFTASGRSVLLRPGEQDGLLLHLVSPGQEFGAEMLLAMQSGYAAQQIQLIQLWEDVWNSRPGLVLSRICGLLGMNRRIHGRKTRVAAVTQLQADEFLTTHHLQGTTGARHRYALYAQDEMVAVATFSARRRMPRRGADHYSIELIRFAAMQGVTVQGGLSKLLNQLRLQAGPDDIMTYADLDWSYGKGYRKLGFEFAGQTAPLTFWLELHSSRRYLFQHLPPELGVAGMDEAGAAGLLRQQGYVPVQNTGNLKYILYTA